MTRQQKLAASEVKYQLNLIDTMPGFFSNDEKRLVYEKMRDALIASHIEVFRHTTTTAGYFDADKFRAMCLEGPFVPSVHDKLCGKKPMTKEKRVHYGIDEEA